MRAAGTAAVPSAGRRDLLAGGLLVATGAATVWQSARLHLGTLDAMGPGFYPCALGVLLMLLGGLVVAYRNAGGAEDGHGTVQRPPDWRGWACIIGGVALFVVLGEIGGLGPATFACVFVAAMGDRRSTLLSSLVLAACCTLFAAGVFDRLLHFQMPFLRPMPVPGW